MSDFFSFECFYCLDDISFNSYVHENAFWFFKVFIVVNELGQRGFFEQILESFRIGEDFFFQVIKFNCEGKKIAGNKNIIDILANNQKTFFAILIKDFY